MSEKVVEVLDEKTYEDCFKAILNSCRKAKTKEELEEKLKEIKQKYGKENTEELARAALVILKKKISKKN